MSFQNIKYCRLIIPELSIEKKFPGVFVIDKEEIRLWLEYHYESYQNSDKDTIQLFNLLTSRKLFTVIVEGQLSDIYSCFDCFSLTGFITTIEQNGDASFIWKTPGCHDGYIEIYCNRWLENLCFENSNENVIDSFKLYFADSAPWFRSIKQSPQKLELPDGTILSFYYGKNKRINTFPYEIAEKEDGFIVCENSAQGFSIDQVVGIANSIQGLLRFSTKIPFQPARISIFDSHHLECVYHGRFGIKGNSTPISVRQYYDFPITLGRLTENECNPIKRWFGYWNHNPKTISRFCECQNPKSYNAIIVEYVIIFDSLSNHFYPNRITDDEKTFKDWVTQVSQIAAEEAKSKGLIIEEMRIKGCIEGLNRSDSLKHRMESFIVAHFDQLNNSIKTKDDIGPVTKYCCDMRHSESHSFKGDDELPKGYSHNEILQLLESVNRIIIEKSVLGIQ